MYCIITIIVFVCPLVVLFILIYYWAVRLFSCGVWNKTQFAVHSLRDVSTVVILCHSICCMFTNLMYSCWHCMKALLMMLLPWQPSFLWH